LSIGTLREMDGTRRQLFSQLQAAGFVSRRARLDRAVGSSGLQARDGEKEQLYSFARNLGNSSLVKCVLTAALYPSVARVGAPGGNSKRPVLLTRTESVAIHPSSVVRCSCPVGVYRRGRPLTWFVLTHNCIFALQNARVDSRELKGYMVFLEKIKTSAVFLRDSTAVSHYPLLLFGGSHLRIDHTKGMQKISIVESDGTCAPTVNHALSASFLTRSVACCLSTSI